MKSASADSQRVRSSLYIHREPTKSIVGKIMSAIFGSKAGAIGRCRADPGQGGGRQEGKAGMAHLDRRSDKGARYRLQPCRAQKLAKELGYTGDTNDSASMNI